MDLLSGPGVSVLKVLQDVDLAGSFRSIFEPAVPVAIIGKPVLPGTGLEDLISRFRPGEFVLEFSHRIALSLRITIS
jgi:hypothetical protein